jgi:uncharacterized protein
LVFIVGREIIRNLFIGITLIILTMVIIKRPRELESIKGIRKWTLVYGRRKTGKTFLVDNFVEVSDYFFVNRDRSIISKRTNAQLTYETLVEILRRELGAGKTVAIDEFHRLGGSFFDLLHSMRKEGRLILLTSTLFLARNLLQRNSPLLGIFHESQIGLIRLDDCLVALKPFGLDKKNLLESSIMMREPIAVDYFDEREDTRKTFVRLLMGLSNTVPALIGEIFQEEDRSLSATYEGITRAVASGKVASGEISSTLYARRLIPKDDPSSIQPYLNNLVKMGILKKISAYGKRKFIYKVASPLMRLFFYADEKYGIAERRMDAAEAERILEELFPHIVEDEVREYFSDRLGLQENVLEAKDYDIDGVLVKFKKPYLLLEVKWGRVDQKDVKKAEKNLGKMSAERKVFFVQDKRGLSSRVLEIIDTGDLIYFK